MTSNVLGPALNSKACCLILCCHRRHDGNFLGILVKCASVQGSNGTNIFKKISARWTLSNEMIDVCFIAASDVSLVRHRLPELHYEKRVGNALWCLKLFTLGNVSLRKVLPNIKLWFAFVATVTSSKPEPVGVSFLRHCRRKLCLNQQQILDTELLRLKIKQGTFYFYFTRCFSQSK
jgi:hypothetical protein